MNVTRELAYFGTHNFKSIAAGAITAMVVHPATRKHGVKLAIWTSANVGRPILAGHLTAASNIARAVSPIALAGAAGYGVGALAGIGISKQFFGASGATKAVELYSSPKKFYEDAILGAPKNISTLLRHYL